MAETFKSVLERLSGERPKLAQVLQRAEAHRVMTCTSLLEGARFKGLEELLAHLEVVEDAFKAHPVLGEVAFLVARARGDFETAIESTLSGYLSVAVDAMRDVIEIENLLLDFSVDEGRMTNWLEATSEVLKRQFKPVDVRRRLAAAGIGNVGERAESIDYAAHSAALHVGPVIHPLAKKGFLVSQGFEGDAGFWEIFEHVRRFLTAIERLMDVYPGESLAGLSRMKELSDLEDAWQRTQQMQTMYLALWQAAAEVGGSDPE